MADWDGTKRMGRIVCSLLHNPAMLALIALVSLLPTVAAPQTDLVARAKAIQKLVPLIDGHNDLPWRIRNAFGGDLSKLDLKLRSEQGQTDIPRLRDGAVGGQFWSVYVPATLSGQDAVKATMEQIDLVYQLCAKYPETFEIALTAADIQRIHKEGKIASLMGMEGGHSIDSSLSILRNMYRMGARYMTLTHSKNTPWADSATDTPKLGGLNAFGESVVREMNRLGMLVDLSHVSDDTMRDAIRVSQAPVIFSHSGSRFVSDHPRNVPDDVLRSLKEKDGVVMVVFLPTYVSPKIAARQKLRDAERAKLTAAGATEDAITKALADWDAKNPSPKATLQEVADHIDHIRDVVGIDYIGIGSDFDGGGGCVGLEDVSKYTALAAELLRRGYTEEDVAKVLGTNLLRVMRKAEQVAARLQYEALR